MALADDLSSALKDAMKAKDKPKLDAIRQIKTAVSYTHLTLPTIYSV